ncbi:hypothetical protein JXO52_06460 [bacterium]|nr:hypothetical protein [bacterium]
MQKIRQLFQEMSAPSLFTRGCLQYKQGDIEESKRLIVKAGAWLPDLADDEFYQAALMLVETRLGKKLSSSRYREVYDSLIDSPYVDTVDYMIIVDGLSRMTEARN